MFSLDEKEPCHSVNVSAIIIFMVAAQSRALGHKLLNVMTPDEWAQSVH